MKGRPPPKQLVMSVRDEVIEKVKRQHTDSEGQNIFYTCYLNNVMPTIDGAGRILNLSFTSVLYKLARAIRTPSRVGQSENGYTDVEIRRQG